MAGKSYYQYETSPRKLEPEYKTRKKIAEDKQKNKKTNLKQKPKKKTKQQAQAKTILYLFICFAVLFSIGYRNTQIDESFVKLQGLKTELAEIQKQNEHLKIHYKVKKFKQLNHLKQT